MPPSATINKPLFLFIHSHLVCTKRSDEAFRKPVRRNSQPTANVSHGIPHWAAEFCILLYPPELPWTGQSVDSGVAQPSACDAFTESRILPPASESYCCCASNNSAVQNTRVWGFRSATQRGGGADR